MEINARATDETGFERGGGKWCRDSPPLPLASHSALPSLKNEPEGRTTSNDDDGEERGTGRSMPLFTGVSRQDYCKEGKTKLRYKETTIKSKKKPKKPETQKKKPKKLSSKEECN